MGARAQVRTRSWEQVGAETQTSTWRELRNRGDFWGLREQRRGLRYPRARSSAGRGPGWDRDSARGQLPRKGGAPSSSREKGPGAERNEGGDLRQVRRHGLLRASTPGTRLREATGEQATEDQEGRGLLRNMEKASRACAGEQGPGGQGGRSSISRKQVGLVQVDKGLGGQAADPGNPKSKASPGKEIPGLDLN